MLFLKFLQTSIEKTNKPFTQVAYNKAYRT